MTLSSSMHMHYATTAQRLELRVPICGFMNDVDEICRDTTLVTCPECRDWVVDPDSTDSGGGEHD
jgi:hypothetical protein